MSNCQDTAENLAKAGSLRALSSTRSTGRKIWKADWTGGEYLMYGDGMGHAREFSGSAAIVPSSCRQRTDHVLLLLLLPKDFRTLL
jgi:hypothetical protein